jgi:hypothetical protein
MYLRTRHRRLLAARPADRGRAAVTRADQALYAPLRVPWSAIVPLAVSSGSRGAIA